MRIVIGIDGSASSLEARDLVASLSWPEGTTVTLITVFELPTAWLGDPALTAGEWVFAAADELRADADRQLTELAVPLEDHGLHVDRRVVHGRAASVILDLAKELSADLIVLGSRGQGPIASMLLGSVSAEVAEQADCSVLVARGPRVARLLVATDGSECAGIIPDELAAWGVFKDLPATCLSVTPVDSPAFKLMVSLYAMGSEPLEAQQRELAEAYRRHAAVMADDLSATGIPTQAEVRAGDAAHEIIGAAEAHDADLVVTGSRCLHGLDRWLLGSVARNVLLHTRASVLIVRRRQGASPS